MRAASQDAGFAARLHRYGTRIGLVVLMLSPSLLYLSKLPDFGRCQYDDYYGILDLLVDGTRMTRDPARWLKIKSNEHWIALPALVYAANIALTHGDNRGLSAFAIVLLFLTWGVLYRLALHTFDLPPPGRWLMGFILATFVFCPSPSDSVVMGFDGAIWFMSNLFSVAALCLLAREVKGKPASVAPVVVVGLLGALSYSTSLFLWPALIVAGLLLRRPLRHLIAIAVTGGAIYLVFFHFYQPMPGHPAPEESHPLLILRYASTYLGNPFSGHVARATVIGGIGILTCVFLVVLVIVSSSRGLQRCCAPWIGLQVYVLGNALATAVTRAGFGLDQAMAFRYSSVSVLFWLAEVALFVVLLMGRRPLWEGSRPQRAVLLVMVLVGVLLALAYHHGLAVYRAYLHRAACQPLAAEAVRRAIPDWEVLRILTPAPEQIRPVWGFLSSHGQVPFDRPEPPLPTGRIRIAPTDRAGGSVQGQFDSLARVNDHTWRAQGWAYDANNPVKEVILVNQRGVAVARMVLGLPRPAGAKVVGRDASRSGWGGYVTLVESEPSPRAAAVLDDGTAVLLHGNPEVVAELTVGFHVDHRGATPCVIPWSNLLSRSLLFLEATAYVPCGRPPNPWSVRRGAFTSFPTPSANGAAGPNEGLRGPVNVNPRKSLSAYVRCAPSGRWSRFEGLAMIPEARSRHS